VSALFSQADSTAGPTFEPLRHWFFNEAEDQKRGGKANAQADQRDGDLVPEANDSRGFQGGFCKNFVRDGKEEQVKQIKRVGSVT
jgi:hypothetical protein